MKIKRSVVLTTIVPEAIADAEIFKAAAKQLGRMGISTIEFYTPFERAAKYGKILNASGLDGIYLGAAFQKTSEVNMSAIDAVERDRAVMLSKKCADAAKEAGLPLLITSGRVPALDSDENAAAEAFEKSLVELMEYVSNDTQAYLETGDRAVQAYQLIGPTPMAVKMAKRMRERFPNFYLTIDTSHIAQLGEDLTESIAMAAPVCRHLHIANCVLKKGDELYGDKHPYIDHMGCHYTVKQLHSIYDKAETMFDGYQDELTVSIEVIAHDLCQKSADRIERLRDSALWFFN